MLSCVFNLAFDALRIEKRLYAFSLFLVSTLIGAGVFLYRLPMNQAAPIQNRYWQTIYEGERKASGELANAVAPEKNPVLWTGHGYPAYLFRGYVADYSGLNTYDIWKSLAAVKNRDPAAETFLKDIGLDVDLR